MKHHLLKSKLSSSLNFLFWYKPLLAGRAPNNISRRMMFSNNEYSLRQFQLHWGFFATTFAYTIAGDHLDKLLNRISILEMERGCKRNTLCNIGTFSCYRLKPLCVSQDMISNFIPNILLLYRTTIAGAPPPNISFWNLISNLPCTAQCLRVALYNLCLTKQLQ